LFLVQDLHLRTPSPIVPCPIGGFVCRIWIRPTVLFHFASFCFILFQNCFRIVSFCCDLFQKCFILFQNCFILFHFVSFCFRTVSFCFRIVSFCFILFRFCFLRRPTLCWPAPPARWSSQSSAILAGDALTSGYTKRITSS
jgi:hypothetical protein